MALVAVLATALSGCAGLQSAPGGHASAPTPASAPARIDPAPPLLSAPLPEIASALAEGKTTSTALVEAYLKRIERIDRAGPRLQSVLKINPKALEDAARLDAERAAGNVRGPLHGVPLLVKDNIETADPMPTTAGAIALARNQTGADSPSIAGLRAAGAIIMGKSNLSEWANFRSNKSISGWSALGGQTRNPYMLNRSPCGSSSGSGASVAAALTAGAIGTETNGSIICPSGANGLVGFKPTLGLVSQERIVPIAPSQDTAGPMTRTVRGSALLLTAMVNRTDGIDYAAQLSPDALKGVRIGVLRFATGPRKAVKAHFEDALEILRAAGATLIEIDKHNSPKTLWPDQLKVLRVEFKAALNAYLAKTPPAVEVRSIDDLIAFNKRKSSARELALFDQSILTDAAAEPDLSDPDYLAALKRIQAAAQQDGIDKLLKDHDVTLLVTPSWGPAFILDFVHRDNFPPGAGVGWMPAIGGYPHLTVPMGLDRGLPVGMSFISTAGKDADVLAAGFAYESRRKPIPAPAYLKTEADLPAVNAAIARPAPNAIP